MLKTKTKFILIIVVAAVICACAQPKPGPQVGTSANYAGWAIEFPSKLTTLTERYTTVENDSRQSFAKFSTFPDNLSKPDWTLVEPVVERSAEVGRSSAYVDTARRGVLVGQFFQKEKESLARRVNGAVKAAAKKNECKCELETYPKVSFALNDSISRLSEESLRDQNDARNLINRYKKRLGKKNISTLQKQSDEIALTSYRVFIEMFDLKEEINSMIEEAGHVKGTIKDALESERDYLEIGELEKAEKLACQKRIAKLEAAAPLVDQATDEAKRVTTEADEALSKLQDEYNAAIGFLLDTIKRKAKEEPSSY